MIVQANATSNGAREAVHADNVQHAPVQNCLPTGPIDPVLASDAFVCLITRDFARQHLIISQGLVDLVAANDGQTNQQDEGQDRPLERFAVSASTSAAVIHNVGAYLQVRPVVTVAEDESIARAIDLAYQHFLARRPDREGSTGQELSVTAEAHEIDRLLAESDRDLLSTQGKGSIVRLVDALLFEALGRGASDVHVHPLSDHTLVRYRIDGVLQTARAVPRSLTQALTSRIKVMGRMDIAERRIAQDGRASVSIGDRSIDLRISTLPTSCGERVVIRLLDNTQHLAEFSQLGMPQDIAGPFLERASAASGLILLTGPTGSGKTTTLYATLRTVGSSEVNIMTIEDPIEYELSLPGGAGGAISQSQVNTKKGVTFATGLRHILRQDPDIVMVGEIRDGETARIAIQSSLTGHLVFSTLHTNDSCSAVTRLIDLGVEPYLVSASLTCALAQRLVRTYHAAHHGGCGGVEGGCEGCFGTGFKGRTGLFELLVVDERIRELISANAALSAIRSAARLTTPPLRTLAEDGERLVQAKKTSAFEVQRVVQGAA
jgi:general secretion pathway protein E